jgi:hypothetical protein
MRIAAVALATFCALVTPSCGGGGVFRQYEYEEEMYLALDGSATVYVNGSVAAIDALRGAAFDTSPNKRPDRDAVSAFYTTPVTRVVGAVQTSSRSNRRFVRVRVDVDDVRRLSQAAPFAWSTYHFGLVDNLFVFRQTVGASAGTSVSTNWTGGELVAFRMHLPSKIAYQNAPGGVQRGNILVWEQPLTERIKGMPLELETRVETQSILYRTLWLFAITGLAVALMFVVVIWLIVRKGAKDDAA